MEPLIRDEGVIKFHCTWEAGPSPGWHKIRPLAEWRQLLYRQGLIGAYADGIGYGNISIRDEPASRFIITGSGTGGIVELGPHHFTRVLETNVPGNSLRCLGPIEASSESLTHAAFYAADRSINAVIHVHHRGLWESYLNVLPTTSAEVAYGTPEMADEITRLLGESRPARQLVVMGGHEEGVMAYGNSLGHAASILLNCCDRMFR